MSKRSVKRYLQDILTAIEKIMPYLSKSSNRGRPRIYKDHQIFSMLIIKEVFSLSQRNHHSLQRLLQKCTFPQRFPLQGE